MEWLIIMFEIKKLSLGYRILCFAFTMYISELPVFSSIKNNFIVLNKMELGTSADQLLL